jgi:hypothetical protein
LPTSGSAITSPGNTSAKANTKPSRKAYEQLNDYREELGNPPLLVVCDFERFEVHTNFTATRKRVYAFTLDDLNRNHVTATCPLPPLDVLRALFGDYNVLRPEYTDAQVTQEAAKLFSRLAESLELENRNLGASREEVAHFLMRLLFCLFADSIGLLPDRVFRNMVQSDDRFRPRKFLRKLKLLFEAMSEKTESSGRTASGTSTADCSTTPVFNSTLATSASSTKSPKTTTGPTSPPPSSAPSSSAPSTPPAAPSSARTTPAKKTSSCSSNRSSSPPPAALGSRQTAHP